MPRPGDFDMKAVHLSLLLFALLVVGCSSIGIDGQFVEPAEATATAQTTSIPVLPTSTPDVAATAIERAIRLTLSATVPPPTDTPPPSPTNTLPPSPTPEPTTAIPPTDTSTPPATKKSAVQATTPPPVLSVQATPTQPTASQKQPIEISVYCAQFGQSPRYVEVDQPVILTWGWLAATEPDRQTFIGAASFSIQIDGQNADTSSASLALTSDSRGFLARWRFPPITFTAGTHQVVLTRTLGNQVTDGFDSNNDGTLDTYGPGATTSPLCEIIVR